MHFANYVSSQTRRGNYLLTFLGQLDQASSHELVFIAQILSCLLTSIRIVGASSDQIVKRYVESRISVTVLQSRGAIRAEPVADWRLGRETSCMDYFPTSAALLMFTGANHMGANGARVSTGEMLQQIDFYCALCGLVLFLI